MVLLKKARARYPGLRQRQRLASRQNQTGADNLRGLAVAANALQSDGAVHDAVSPDLSAALEAPDTIDLDPHADSSHNGHSVPAISLASSTATPTLTTTTNTDDPSHTSTGPDHLPDYIVKSIGPNGWAIITNEHDWYHVLREKAFAVWADGVCNVLVELGGGIE